VPGLVLDIIEKTPVGVTGVVSSGPRVFAVEIGARSRRALSNRLALRFAPQCLFEGKSRAGRELAEYFAGKRRAFDLECVLEGLPGFCVRVLLECAKIPFGRTLTYGDVARALRNPQASRAVGQALARNPAPIVIPCHRVVGAGSIGGFSAAGGLAAKRALLDLEGVRLPWPASLS